MRRSLTLIAAAALTALAMAGPAAAGELCYDVQVDAQGAPVVAESGCQELPA